MDFFIFFYQQREISFNSMKLKVQEDDMHRERFGSIKIPLLLLLASIQPTPKPLDFLNKKVKKNLTRELKYMNPHIFNPLKHPIQTK